MNLCFSLCLSIYLFIIRLPLSVESRFGVRAYSPGETVSAVLRLLRGVAP